MYLFLGDKKEIGIEFIFDKLIEQTIYYGYGKIWLGGNFLGSIMDRIYFDSYLLGQLQDILNCKEIIPDILQGEMETQYDYFEGIEQDEYSLLSYRVNTTSFTDMYNIYAYKVKNNITILWKRNWEDTYDDVKEQNKTVFYYEFEEEKLLTILRILDDIQKIKILV